MAKYIIVDVDCVPCELIGQEVEFDDEGSCISEPLQTPWPMPWVKEIISDFNASGQDIPEKSSFKLVNPEEDDQMVFIQYSGTPEEIAAIKAKHKGREGQQEFRSNRLKD